MPELQLQCSQTACKTVNKLFDYIAISTNEELLLHVSQLLPTVVNLCFLEIKILDEIFGQNQYKCNY